MSFDILIPFHSHFLSTYSVQSFRLSCEALQLLRQPKPDGYKAFGQHAGHVNTLTASREIRSGRTEEFML